MRSGEEGCNFIKNIIRPLIQGFGVGGTNRVRHHREGVAFESMGDGHVFRRTDKRFGTDHRCRSS